MSLIDFTQASTWRGILGLAAVFGFSFKPELADQIAIGLGAGLSIVEMLRDEYANHKTTVNIELPRPAAASPPEQLRQPVPSDVETQRNPEDSGFGNR